MNGQSKTLMSAKEMAGEMISATKEFITRALKPYEDRLAELERRAPIPGKDGRDGKDGVGKDGKDGKDGESVDFDAVVDAVVKRIPIPKDGRDGVDGKVGKEGAAGKDGKDGTNGIDGKSIDPAEVERLVIGYVQKAVGSLPVPRDGRDGRDGASVSVEAVEALVRAEVAKAVSVIPAGKDGRDAEPVDTDAVIASVVKQIPAPKDGKDGKSVTIEDVTPFLEAEVSKWELAFERRAFDKLQKAIERLPTPKDGIDGKDGRDGVDGFGIDEFDMDYDGERTFTFKWANADRKDSRQFKAPIPLYREVWKSNERYERGDIVTYGGSQWTAIKDELGTPGDPDSGWRLSVKRGQK